MNAPAAFVQEIWPWLVDLFGRITLENLSRFLTSTGITMVSHSNEKPMIDNPLQNAIEVAVRGFADSDVRGFY